MHWKATRNASACFAATNPQSFLPREISTVQCIGVGGETKAGR